MKNTIGIFEAKTHLTQLINQVQEGEEIVITRRGLAVAKIISINQTHDVGKAKLVARRLKTIAKQMKIKRFDWNEWKSYRDEGRS